MKINGARGGGGGGSTIVSAADEIDGKEVPIASGETKERAQHSVVCMSFFSSANDDIWRENRREQIERDDATGHNCQQLNIELSPSASAV